MILKIIKFLILFLVLCNIPGFLLVYLGSSAGTISSYLTTGLLVVYIIFTKPWQKPVTPIILCSLLYFVISSLSYDDDQLVFIKEFIRVLILIFAVTEVLHKTSYKDVFIIMLVSALSIIINGLFFPSTNALYGLVSGRFSGFLLNPNTAGITCLIGMALSYSIENVKLKYAGQILLTFAGILTLSRTFILVWAILVIISIYKDRKNIIVPISGIIAFIILTTFTDKKVFAADRLDALTSFFQEGKVKRKTLQNDTRDQTWALYYDLVFEKPILGNGYRSFQVHNHKLPGVHNTYLMILGESGILPFIFLIGIYIYLLRNCILYFKIDPILMYLLIVIMLDMMVSHTYYFIFLDLTLTIFVYLRIREIKISKEKLLQLAK